MMKKDDKISHSELVSLVGIQGKKIDELTSINEELIVEKETLNSSNKELISLNEKLKGDNERLSLLLAMGKARTFGNKSEPIDKEEINLFNFNEVEATAETTLEAEVKELQNPKVRKPKSKNHSKIDFEKYVTKTIIHDPSESVQGSFENISEESVYKAHVKVNIEVTKHVFKTIKNKETGELLTNTRDFAFNNYIATPSLVSYLANEKYLMGTPLYRQEQAFLSAGFFLSRVDQSNYLMTSSNTLPILSISEVSTD